MSHEGSPKKIDRRDFLKGVPGAVTAGILKDSLSLSQFENVPNEAGIAETFGILLAGIDYTEKRKLSDELGVYIWEVMVPVSDGSIEFSYMRAGRYKEGQSTGTKVYLTFFDEDEMPVGGTNVAEYKAGQWKVTG